MSKEIKQIDNKTTTSLNQYVSDNLSDVVTTEELIELQESSLLMESWSKDMCTYKQTGGMEEWGKVQESQYIEKDNTCGWYHGTWQHLQLLNMVAIPRWYPFYQEALCSVFSEKSNPRIMVSGAADYGIIRTIHDAMQASQATPEIVLYDICETPLKSARWYANRHGFLLKTHHTNILDGSIESESFDLVVTDEFLTVLNEVSKTQAVSAWKRLLKPGGRLVTTAMIGEPTTEDLRRRYAERAHKLFLKYGELLFPNYISSPSKANYLIKRFETFAALHTRHMIRDEAQVLNLLDGFTNIVLKVVETPGECVNPTFSFQITAEA